MSDDTRACPSCGAHVSSDAEACDLCGTPIETSADDGGAGTSDPAPADGGEQASVSKSPSETSSDPPDSASAPEQVYCNECGWENPADANYCSQCGSELQDLADGAASSAGTRAVSADLPSGTSESADASADATDEPDEQAEMGQQILMVVGGALVVVLALFFVTQWSQQYEWGSDSSASDGTPSTQQQAGGGGTPSATGGQGGGRRQAPASPQAAAAQGPTDLSALVSELSGPVEGPVADQIDSLETAVDEAEDAQQRQLQAQLVKLYIGAGAPGRAAEVQTTLADRTGRVQDRRRAANLLYKWMRQVERDGNRAKVADVARHVAQSYAAVLEQRPEDLDSRTRMGEAYLLTNSPMKGIRAINQVLDDDSTFVPARFQKGLALLQINRLDQAVSEFQQVMEYASQDDPFYQQAKRAIEVIREQANASGNGGSGGTPSSDS